MHRKAFHLLFFLFIILLIGCESNYTPLPRAYFRIDLPDKEYTDFDTIFPYRFQYPVYAEIIPDTRNNAEPWWADVYFPKYKAVLHLSYKPIQDQNFLNEYIEDSRSFVNRHIPKATEFNEKIYTNEAERVYGMLYEIKGREAATPIQFYLTDSTDHFLRGSLYFNVSPNNDSLAPVIDFLKEDILILVESLEWTR
jgi:gliding motility-associated lipoprotein GldD